MHIDEMIGISRRINEIKQAELSTMYETIRQSCTNFNDLKQELKKLGRAIKYSHSDLTDVMRNIAILEDLMEKDVGDTEIPCRPAEV